VAAGQLAPLEAEEALDGGTGVRDMAVRADKVQAVGTVLDEEAEAGFSLPRELDRAGIGVHFHRQRMNTGPTVNHRYLARGALHIVR
jgi:hypothetical protein